MGLSEEVLEILEKYFQIEQVKTNTGFQYNSFVSLFIHKQILKAVLNFNKMRNRHLTHFRIDVSRVNSLCSDYSLDTSIQLFHY